MQHCRLLRDTLFVEVTRTGQSKQNGSNELVFKKRGQWSKRTLGWVTNGSDIANTLRKS